MKKRRNHLSAKLLCLTLLAVVLYACQSDVYETETSDVEQFSVGDAKRWYDAAARLMGQNSATVRSADGAEEVITLTPKLNWNIAEMSNNEEWEVVELAWRYEEVEEVFALWEVWQYAKAVNVIPENVTKLVVMQNRKSGDTYGFKMRIAPTLDYLLHHGENLQSNMYLERDSGLSGIVVFYWLNGELINGWRYLDGVIVAELVEEISIDSENLNTQQTRNTGPWLTNEGVGFYGGSLDEPIAIGKFPQVPNTSLIDQDLAYIKMKESALAASGSGDAGNAGVEKDKGLTNGNVNDIFKDVKQGDRAALEVLLKEMLQNCLGQALFNSLVYNGNTFTFEFWNSTYNTIHPVNLKISLANDGLSSFYLFHELFHGYQLNRYDFYTSAQTAGQWDRDFINIEIEAHLLFYHYILGDPNGMNATWKRVYEDDDMYRSIARLAENIDSNGRVINTGEFDHQLKNVVAPAFIKGHTNSHRPNPQFNPNMPHSTMFSGMNDLWRASEDCRNKQNKR